MLSFCGGAGLGSGGEMWLVLMVLSFGVSRKETEREMRSSLDEREPTSSSEEQSDVTDQSMMKGVTNLQCPAHPALPPQADEGHGPLGPLHP